MEVVTPILTELTQPEWWNSVELWSALLGAIVGGVISAAVSFFVARESSRETLKRDEVARIAQERAVALTATVKVRAFINNLYSASQSILSSIEYANANGHQNLELWQKVQPLVGNPELQPLDASELAFFIGVDTELADGLTLLQAKAESLLDAVKVYGRRRLELTDTLSADVQDKMRFTRFTPELEARIAPRAGELDGLAHDIMWSLREDLAFGIPLSESIGKACASYFQVAKFPRLNFDNLKPGLEKFLAVVPEKKQA